MDVTSPKHEEPLTTNDKIRQDTGLRWAAIGVVVVGIIALFAIFHETAYSFIPIWNTSSFGHGYLIVPISAWLFWLNRHRIFGAAMRPSIVGCGVMLLLAVAWALGEIADVNIVRQAAFVGMIQGIFLTVLGWRAFREAVFPLGYLVFAVPFGEFLIPHLQDITASFAAAALNVLGVPVFNDGIFIQTPAGNYLVAEACSGSRYLLSTLAISSLASGLFFTSWTKRIGFVALGVFVSIAANAVRAAGVILLAYWVDPSLAGPVHVTYGLVFVAIVTLLYLLAGASFKERAIGEYAEIPSRGVAQNQRVANSSTGSIIGTAGGAILGVAAIAGYVHIALVEGNDQPISRPNLPQTQGQWEPVAATSIPWRPEFLGITTEAAQEYSDGNRHADLFVGIYETQRRGSELINQGNRIEGSLWERAGSGAVRIDRKQGPVVDANYVRLLPKRSVGNVSDVSGRIVWYWFWVGGQYTASPLWAKVLEAKAILLGQSRAAAVIAISAVYRDEPSEAMKTLREFGHELGPLKPVLVSASEPPSGEPNR